MKAVVPFAVGLRKVYVNVDPKSQKILQKALY